MDSERVTGGSCSKPFPVYENLVEDSRIEQQVMLIRPGSNAVVLFDSDLRDEELSLLAPLRRSISVFAAPLGVTTSTLA